MSRAAFAGALVVGTYVGFMLVIVLPSEDGVNSLLMNRPVGWVYLRPLGAVSSTVRSDGMVTDV